MRLEHADATRPTLLDEFECEATLSDAGRALDANHEPGLVKGAPK